MTTAPEEPAPAGSRTGGPIYAGPFGWLRRVDDAVFRVEQTIVATFLLAMSAMVFLDVVYRRLISPDSKIGSAIATLGGIDDAGTRAFIDANVAPWLTLLLTLGIFWFGFWTAERHRERPLLPFRQGALALAALATAATGTLGWLMVQPWVESRYFYVLLYGLIALGWLAALLLKRPRHWQLKIFFVLAVLSPAFVAVALKYFPRGYSWSKEVSLIMLLWVGFLGASVCAHEGKHLRMEAFERLVPDRLKRYVHTLGFLATAAFCAFLALLGYRYVFDPIAGAYVLGGVFEQTQIPDWIAIVAVPVTFGITMLRFLGAAVSALMGGTYGAHAEDTHGAPKGGPEPAETEGTA